MQALPWPLWHRLPGVTRVKGEVVRKLWSGLSYANVMATVAVFIAIGGGAYAAGLARNSVGSKQLKNDAVRSVDVKADSLKGADVDESKLELPEGPQGPPGERGPRGLQGPAGDFADVDGQDILDKLGGFMGDGSGLNADAVDGFNSIDLGPIQGNQIFLDVPESGDTASESLVWLPFSGSGGHLEFEAKCANDAGSITGETVLHNTRDEPVYVWANGGQLIELDAGGSLSSDELAGSGSHVTWLIETTAHGQIWQATTAQGGPVDFSLGNCVATAVATYYDYAQP